jgi:PEP-CTERM motif
MLDKILKLLASLMLCFASAATQAAFVSLVPSTPTPVQGEIFTLDVALAGTLDEAIAFGFDIANSAPGIASFVSATVAAPFDDDSGLFAGTDVAGSAFPGVTGDPILLAILRFRALSPGGVDLGIFSSLLDPNEGVFFALDPRLDLTSSVHVEVHAVPEPSSYLLFVVGLLGLATITILRRR